MSSKWITPTVKQTWVSLSPLLNKAGAGMIHGFLTCLAAGMKAPDSDFSMSISTWTWFASSLGIASLVGLLVGSIVMDKYGRRPAFITVTVPAVAGMLLMGATSNIVLLFLGRIFCGLCIGCTNILGAVVISEYTSPEHRPMFLNLTTASLNIGSLVIHLMGHYLHWRTVAFISALPFALSLVITLTWPESPSWLAEKKKYKRSEQAFYWLRGENEDSIKEIKELLKSQQNDVVEKTFEEKVADFMAKFKKRNFIKPAIIILIATFLLEVSGRHFFPSYAGVLIEKITSGKADPFLYNIIIDVLIILSGIISSVLTRRFGLKQLLFVSGFVTVLVLFIACILLYLVQSETISESYAFVPLYLFVSFFFLSNLGCTSVPLALVGEILPLEHRAFGSLLAGYSLSTYTAIFLKAIPFMIREYMIYGAFAILGGCITLGLVLLFFTLPDTKNRTLLEIEEYFNTGKFGRGDPIPVYTSSR